MVKAVMFAMVVGGLMLVGSTSAGAQCLTLSPTPRPCAAPTKTRPLFGRSLDIPMELPKRIAPLSVASSPSQTTREPKGLDCEIAREPDPKFRSAMPVLKSNPSVTFALRVIPVAPCKP